MRDVFPSHFLWAIDGRSSPLTKRIRSCGTSRSSTGRAVVSSCLTSMNAILSPCSPPGYCGTLFLCCESLQMATRHARGRIRLRSVMHDHTLQVVNYGVRHGKSFPPQFVARVGLPLGTPISFAHLSPCGLHDSSIAHPSRSYSI